MSKTARIEIRFGSETLVLTNRRTAFLPSRKLLVLSDLHVGKTAHFRKNGIAVPSGLLLDDLRRLQSQIEHFAAREVMIVGDLFHAGDNSDIDIFCEWRQNFSDIDFTLVEGNHDRVAEEVYEKACLHAVNERYLLGGLQFVHDPADAVGTEFFIAGHLHPGVIIPTGIGGRLRLPCFHRTDSGLILPAFSKFTGLDTRNLPKGQSYVFTDQSIFRL